ncbi:MAG: tetratricopeptide repeat protein [Nostocaceae cyanobacterium]|nr:tetratricopeptide repeat protein [Nostocaceae cyanobacterium]
MLRRLSVTITVTLFCLVAPSLTLAETRQPTPRDQFAPNPLEINVPDPLLPQKPDNQPLTSQEKQQLEIALAELTAQAAAKLQTGDKPGAFEIWNRELRLRRALGSQAEVEALSRVGAIAWSQNERQEVQYITQRLQTIQKQTQLQTPPDIELLRSLGQAFQQVRSPKNSLDVYNQVLIAVREKQDVTAEVETLKTIAEVHLGWLDYTNAAATYEELLRIASSKSDRLSEVRYLQQLAYIYDQSKQTQSALTTKTKLAELYQSQNNPENLLQFSALQLSIGEDYEALLQTDAAFKAYQQAYQTAWGLQQYARAGDALRKLIPLYRRSGQIDNALTATQTLIDIEQKFANNFYGLMKAYDELGQIYQERKNYPQAREAFQKGLEVAQQLRYQEAYFTKKLQEVNQ